MRYYSSWRQHQARENWKSLFSIFLTIVLLFAAVSGLSKGFLLSSKLSANKWDNKSPMAVAIGAKNPAVFIYLPDSKKMVVLSVDGQVVYESGKSPRPLAKISDAMGASLTGAMSKTFGAKIDNYIEIKNSDVFDKGGAQKVFKSFASLTTPFSILTRGYRANLASTNITRLDALSLWWRLKSLSTKDIFFADLSSVREEILDETGQTILGADTASLNKEIGKYLQDLNITNENFNITIKNASGSTSALRLAVNFVTSAGGKIVDVESANTIIEKSNITVTKGDSYTASYLAKMFECDINVAQNTDSIGEITINLGQDFAKSYF